MTQAPSKTLFMVLRGLGVVGAIWLAGRIGLTIEGHTGISVIPLWLPSGISLGVLFLLGEPSLPFVWLGSFLISLGRPIPIAAVFATGDILSAWLGWRLLTRLPEFNKEFRRARDVLLFVSYGAILSTLSGAVIGVGSQALWGLLPWRTVPGTFLTWWLGNVSGVLVAAPLLLRWSQSWWSQLRLEGRVREAIAAYASIGLLILLLLPPGDPAVVDALWKLLSWPLLLWAAMRLGSFGAPSAMFFLAIGNVLEFLRSIQAGRSDPQRLLWDHWAATMALSIAGLVVMALEAARTRADRDREKLQMQLAQAQKMESVGRLASGIAHDFNNLLTVINGQSELALRKLMTADPLRPKVAQILEAGERAAALTQQLLAFSRQTVLEARVIDLNGVVEGMQSMLGHLASDNVEISLDLHAAPLPVWADVHQLEQVILNLAVNARDAMPKGGQLRIATAVAEWGEREAVARLAGRPGRYAMLAVADNGAGMDEAVRQRIFEPFFTTKPQGEGTGLGLSMVQGIVDQSGGYIDLDSKPGHGTTFRIYLPLRLGEKIHKAAVEPVPVRRGRANVLVVEDRPEVRRYVAEVLRAHGYDVIEAGDAEEALQQSSASATPLDLVVTDIMMPGLSGPDLVARLTASQPGLKVLFMSGYSDQDTFPSAVPRDAGFLQKPFGPQELAEKVQSILMA